MVPWGCFIVYVIYSLQEGVPPDLYRQRQESFINNVIVDAHVCEDEN